MNSRTKQKSILFGLLGLAACITVVPAGTVLAEDKPEADLSVGFLSKYVWRGYELSQDSMVVQPSMGVSYKGFGCSLWGNFDTNQAGTETANWNETDVTLSYDGSAGIVGYGVGLIYYGLEDGAEDTTEVYGSLSLDTLLSPTLTVYRDIDNYPGWYATLGVSHSVKITDSLNLDLGAQISYLDDDEDYSEFHDALLSISMSVPVTERISVTPEIYYSFALSDAAKDAIEAASIDGDQSNFIYGGVSVSFAF